MLSEYAVQTIIRALKASQEYSENDDLGEFLKLLDGARWRKYPNEKPEKQQIVMVSMNGHGPVIVSYYPISWQKFESELYWLPVPEIENNKE